MKVLRWLITGFILAGLLVAIASVFGVFALNYSSMVRDSVVRWKITKIFENHGHVVVWEKPIKYAQLPRHLAVEVEKWEHATDGWKIPTGDYSRAIGQRMKSTTLIHVLEVKNAIPNGSLLAIFLFEDPTSLHNVSAHTVNLEERKITTPQHHHHGAWYIQMSATGVWGDMTLFPLENYFPLQELRGRRSWIPQIRSRVSFWGGGIAIGFIVLALSGVFFLNLKQLHIWSFHMRAQWRMYTLRFKALLVKTPQPTFQDNLKTANRRSNDDLRISTILPANIDMGIKTYNQQEEGRREQADLRAKIEKMQKESTGESTRKFGDLLSQFPSQKRVRLSKARELFARARKIYEERDQNISALPSPDKRIDVPISGNKTSSDNSANIESGIASSDRWLYGLFEEMYPCILKERGDPIVATAIVLSFIQPKQQVSFVGGSYKSFEEILSNTSRKTGEIFRIFGRRISPEAIKYNFEILEKGKVVLSLEKTGRGHGKSSYSLNDDEKYKDVFEPWNEVIKIINRARAQLIFLHNQAKP